jgi:hypothetical protein
LKLVIPVNKDNRNIIESLNSNPIFLKLELNELSKPSSKEFVESEEDFLEDTDYIIVNSPTEPIFRYFDYSIYVLHTSKGSSVDDILEAFLFKELQEVIW